MGTEAAESWDLEEVYSKFIIGGQKQPQAKDLEEVYSKFISGGQMQLKPEIWQRFITSLLVGDRCY